MSGFTYKPLDQFTDEDLYHFHWYGKLRTSQERRQLYQWLRELGVSVVDARRVKDWSTPHIISFVRTTILGKGQISTKDLKINLIDLPK